MKRSRQSDVMSDIENLDVMLGAYSRNDLVEDENNTEPEVDLESGRHQWSEGQTENNFRSLLNTNTSENSEITVETNRLINSEISSQMSRKIEELKTDLNSHILDVINSALEERVLPSIKNALETMNSAKNANLDLRSDGPHSNDFSQERAQRDLRSYGRHPENPTQRFQDAQNDFPRLETMRNNRTNHCRRNSIDSINSNENDDGYDTTNRKVLGENIRLMIFRETQFRDIVPNLRDPESICSENHGRWIFRYLRCYFLIEHQGKGLNFSQQVASCDNRNALLFYPRSDFEAKDVWKLYASIRQWDPFAEPPENDTWFLHVGFQQDEADRFMIRSLD